MDSENLDLSGPHFELVANVIEIRGRGVLLLGSGKSSGSILLTLLYPDTYLVADDYCSIIRIAPIWGNLLHYYRMVHYQAKPSEESYKFFEKAEYNGSHIFATAWRVINGEIRPTLGTYLRQIPMLHLELEQLGVLPPKEEYPKTIEAIKTQRLREIRITTRFIDTIAQRVAHKAWCHIDAIIFLMENLLTVDNVKWLLDTNQKQIQEELGEQVNPFYQYLSQFLFDKSSDRPRHDTIFLEKDPTKRNWLATFCWLYDTRGHDWRILLENTDIPLYFAFHYNSFLEKIQAVYRYLLPFRIYDEREDSLKYITEED